MSLATEILDELDKTLTLADAEQEYKDYITEHIENVKKVWDVVKTIDNKWIQNNLEQLEENIKHHDESKWSDEEFEAYRKKYYPIDDEERTHADADFEPAWNHHYTNNKHHWQYWTCSDGDLDATKHNDERIDNDVMVAYIEMLCDWGAMSIKFGNRPDEWYKSNKDNMTLWTNEQKELEKILKEYCKKLD